MSKLVQKIIIFCIAIITLAFSNSFLFAKETDASNVDISFEAFDDLFTYYSANEGKIFQSFDPALRKKTIKLAQIAVSKFDKIDYQDLLKIDRFETIALFVNLYNTISAYLDANFTQMQLHPSLKDEKLVKVGEKFISYFEKDPFFNKEYIYIGSIGKISLKDIYLGIFLKDPVYLQTVNDKSKKEKIIELNEALFGGNQDAFDPDMLFLLSCGSEIFPLYRDFGIVRGFRGTDLSDPAIIDKIISNFMLRAVWAIYEHTTLEKGLLVDVVKMTRVIIPYAVGYYANYLSAKYKSRKEFLLRFLPDDCFISSTLMTSWVGAYTEGVSPEHYEYESIDPVSCRILKSELSAEKFKINISFDYNTSFLKLYEKPEDSKTRKLTF